MTAAITVKVYSQNRKGGESIMVQAVVDDKCWYIVYLDRKSCYFAGTSRGVMAILILFVVHLF